MSAGVSRGRNVLLLGLAVLMSLAVAAEGLGRWADNRGIGLLLDATGSQDADFLASRAQRLFEFRDYAGAEEIARRAVLGAPLHQKAVRLLGMAEIAQGKTEVGNRTVRAAGMLGWQDVPTQAWLMLDFLQRGDAQGAIYRADALARRGGMRPEMLQMLTIFAADPSTLSMLLERLELQPGWRRDFFRLASTATPAQTDTLDMLLRRLQRGATPPTREEVAPVVRHWVKLGSYARAEALAADLLGQQGPGGGNLIGDGGFALLDVYRSPNYERTPFDWEIGSARGATATVGASEGQGDGALYVESNGSRDAVLASKTIRVPPGAYRMSFMVESADADALERFQWSLGCLPGAEPLALEAGVTLVPNQARRVELPFTVPAQGCDAQMLSLHALSASRETVSARIDDIEIRPQP